MKLGLKIILPILSLLIIITGGFGYILHNLQQQETVISAEGVKIRALNGLNERLNRQQDQTEYNVLAYRFNQDRTSLLAISQSELDKSKTLDEMYPFITTPHGRELVTAYIESRDEIESLKNGLIRAIDEGDEELIALNYNKWNIQTQNIKAALADIGAYNINSLEKTLVTVGDIRNKIFGIIISLIFVVIVTILFLSFYLRVVITTPIIKLAQFADEVANRNFTTTTTTTTTRKDELGMLSRAFNTMIFKLKESYSSLEHKVEERTADLQKSNTFLDAIIENIPNMIFLKDAKELRFVRLNKAGEELIGYDRKDLIGKNDFDFFPETQADFFIQKDHEVLKNGEFLDIPEEQIETKFKGKRWLHTKKIPLNDIQGKPEYLLGISEDITERIKIDNTKAAFISLASHQLRTPLTIIRWSLEKMIQSISSLEPSMQRKLRASYSGALRMGEIINTILTVGRIDSGKIGIHNEDVAVEPMLKGVVEELKYQQHKKSAMLSIDCASGLSVRTDPHLLKEMVENLISNAIKYTPESGNVCVRACEKDGWLELTVQDNGPGIPPDQQSHIFEKFFRADNILSVDPDGIGLGLYLTYAFAEILGGTLTFQSALKKGTTFTLRLPISLHE